MKKLINNNCLPEGLETIQDKIEYVKACYGIIGENGNLFDWILKELRKEKIIKELTKEDILELKELLSYGINGKKIYPDEEEVLDIYNKCIDINNK